MKKINRTRKRVLKRMAVKRLFNELQKVVAVKTHDLLFMHIINENKLSYGEILDKIMEEKNGKRD